MSSNHSVQARALRLVEAALDMDPATWDDWLAEATRDDPAVLPVARRLLESCARLGRSPEFLASTAQAFAAPVLTDVERQALVLSGAEFEALQVALADRYALGRELGRGGSAIVYLARDLRHPREVAIKVIRHGLTDPGQRRRFAEEIATIARLRHPYIVPLLDSGDVNGVIYYVMPWINGETLRARIDREKVLPVPVVQRIVGEVAEALAQAHAQHIVHRDIKPQNILLDGDHALVADFGIATSDALIDSERVTLPGVVVGTPHYMSPEQGCAQPLDHRSDIYSLGCVAYEMLTGEAPYTGGTARAVISKHVGASIPDVGILRHGVPQGIRRAVTRALAKHPADRYPDVLEFARGMRQETASESRPPWAPWVLGAALTVALGLYASTPSASWRAVRPDTTAIAVFPLAGDTGVTGRLDTRLQDAIGGWTGIRVVDAATIAARASALRRSWDAREGSRIASDVGAGRMIWGEVSRRGDSLRLRVRLADVGTRGLVLAEEARTMAASPGADSVLVSVARLLLVRPPYGIPLPPTGASASLPALQAFAWALRSVARWQLDTAGSLLDRAIEHDATFGHAHLWNAIVRNWRGEEVARFSVPAAQANVHRQFMDARERELSRATLLESRRDMGAACQAWTGLAQRDSTDFVVWYGSARCRHADSVVVPDARSPSGWRFRSSFQQAVREYERAFQLNPAILAALSAGSFEPLRRLLMAGGAFYAVGRLSEGAPNTHFARIALEGDTLVLIPWQGPGSMNAAVTASQVDAVNHLRRVMRSIAATWASVPPRSAAAIHALAVSLAQLSEPGASDTLRSAFALASDPEELWRLRLAELWLRLGDGVTGMNAATLASVRRTADSLLTTRGIRDSWEPRQLMALAALIGKAPLAAALGRRTEVVAEARVPGMLASVAYPLLVFSAVPAPPESLEAVAQRTREIIASADSGVRTTWRRQWLARAAHLCAPACPLSRDTGLIALDVGLRRFARLRAGDTVQVRRELAALRSGRRQALPEDLTLDVLATEAELWLLLGEPEAAADWLRPTMDRANRIPLAMLADPTRTAGLVHAMRVRARAAEALGQDAEGKRWSALVNALQGSGRSTMS